MVSLRACARAGMKRSILYSGKQMMMMMKGRPVAGRLFCLYAAVLAASRARRQAAALSREISTRLPTLNVAGIRP